MSEIALQRIREAKEQKLTSLDLSNLDLKTLPKELSELIWLEKLIADGNKELSDLSPLQTLTNLQELRVAQNQVSDLRPLSQLINLEDLYFHQNQVSDLTPLSPLTNLQSLAVHQNQISDLTPLSPLINLLRLAISENQISDLTPLSLLSNLEDLYVNQNQVSDLTPLSPLTNLQSLHLYQSKVHDLSPLLTLRNLKTLDIENTEVRDLSPLQSLTNLQTLDIQHVKIKNFESITPFLNKKLFPKLTELRTHGIPLNEVEEKYLGAVYENTLEKLRKFHKQWLKGERRRLYEAKLILVGEGAVGKTSLKQKLKNNKNYVAKPNKTPSTEGILYEPWMLKGCLVNGEKRDVRINIWDFGGQEVDHQTHQFFLSRNSFYVYVSNSRLSDAQSKFDYWLNIIHKLAPESPILLVRNLFDNQTEPFRFKEWLKQYPEQISSKPITIDCTKRDDAGVNEVLAYIKTKISELDSVGKVWPKSYADIREELETLAENGTNYIEESVYLDICTKHDVDNEEARGLSETLHSIGTILHYQDTKEAEDLKDWVILRPEWVTKAFYRIVRNGEINVAKGKFTKDQLKTIWWKDDGDKEKYPLSIFPILIDLMKAFDLCFQIDAKKEYIVPQLLNEEENEQAKAEVDGDDVLRFEYHYNDVIPAGMISRFICKQHNNISKDPDGNYLYWRYGALMAREQTVALVEQAIGDKIIKITVKGTAKRELLAIVRNAFEELHAPLNNLKPDEILPCNCSVCLKSNKPHPFKYDVIKRRLQREDVYEICEISDEKVDRRKLFNDAIDESFRNNEKIRQLVADGKMEQAINLFGDKNEKALLGGHLSRIKREELLGLLGRDAAFVEKNRMSKAIIELSKS